MRGEVWTLSLREAPNISCHLQSELSTQDIPVRDRDTRDYYNMPNSQPERVLPNDTHVDYVPKNIFLPNPVMG